MMEAIRVRKERKKEMNNKKLISTSQLAKHLGVTRQAIYKWRKKGMPVFINHLQGKLIRYELEEVVNWLNREQEQN
jgi:phage terminase Nu1 subunit (DNA packaging protein)